MKLYGNNEIYIVNADGSDPRRLTDNPGDDFAPAWSPDGSQIDFRSVQADSNMSIREAFESIVVGGGRAGLAVGYYFVQQGNRVVIPDGNKRAGDRWRRRLE